MLKMREIQKMSKKVVTLKLEKDMSPHGSFTTFPIFRMMMAWLSLFEQAL